ncbi:MAG: hypothetical protein WCX88_02500 [Patescibacteria group bacterium]
MTQRYNKFEYNGVKIEANYKPNVVPCKKVKITIDGKSAEIDRSDLYNLLVLFADDEEMDKCLNVKGREMVMIKKAVMVQTREAIPAGGEIKFFIEYPLPADEYDEWLKNNKDLMVKEEEAKSKL